MTIHISDEVLLASTRVVRGVELLDAKEPGWRDRINLEALNLGDVHQCVLGQTFGHYLTGLGALGIEAGGQSRDHGFTASECDYGPDVLDNLWKEVIR